MNVRDDQSGPSSAARAPRKALVVVFGFLSWLFFVAGAVLLLALQEGSSEPYHYTEAELGQMRKDALLWCSSLALAGVASLWLTVKTAATNTEAKPKRARPDA